MTDFRHTYHRLKAQAQELDERVKDLEGQLKICQVSHELLCAAVIEATGTPIITVARERLKTMHYEGDHYA